MLHPNRARNSALFFLLLSLSWPTVSQAIEAAESDSPWELLPIGRSFPTLLSDPRDLKLGLRRNTRQELEADVGGYRSVFGYRHPLTSGLLSLHFGVEGSGYFQLAQEGNKFPLESTDGLIGIFADAALASWAYQLRVTHLSAHLGDGLTGKRSRIPYSRETLSLRVSKQFNFILLYAGYYFLVHTEPELPRNSLQVGGTLQVPLWPHLQPYLGFDFRLRSQQEGNAFTATAGIALVANRSSAPIRLAVHYFAGRDPRGQFYQEQVHYWNYGLEFDF